jgi:hypothetical protein
LAPQIKRRNKYGIFSIQMSIDANTYHILTVESDE